MPDDPFEEVELVLASQPYPFKMVDVWFVIAISPDGHEKMLSLPWGAPAMVFHESELPVLREYVELYPKQYDLKEDRLEIRHFQPVAE